MNIARSPFQKALIHAALERFRRDLKEETEMKEADPENCLWINWQTGTISLSVKHDCQKYVCSSPAQRTAVIDSLKEKHFTIIP